MKNQILHKFLGIYLLLLLLVPITIAITSKSQNLNDLRSKAANKNTVLSFWPNIAVLEPNSIHMVQVNLTGNNKPDSFDLVLSFDPKVVNIENGSPTPGSLYGSYHAKYFDNTKGLIGLSGKGLNGEGLFFSFKFKTVGSGNANFQTSYINPSDAKVDIQLPNLTVR